MDDLYRDIIVHGWTEYVNSPETFAVKIMNEREDPVFEDPLVMHGCYIYTTTMGGSDDYIADVFDLLKQLKNWKVKVMYFQNLLFLLLNVFTVTE